MRRSLGLVLALAGALATWPLQVPATADQGRGSQNYKDDDRHDGHHDDGKDDAPLVAVVSFGVGLNTAALGEPNHHLVPDEIRIKKGGVVNFIVGGFHQIFVYLPGTRPKDVLDNAPDFPGAGVTPNNLFINYGFPIDPMNPILYYAGINPGFPAGPPGLPPLPPENPLQGPNPPVFSNTFNRVESVSFSETGRYLVICNINPHFRDGMYAWIRVTR
jgi:hypothetical protein